MYNEYETARRDVVEAILRQYHKTRLADTDPVDFILSSKQVQLEFSNYAMLYASG